MRAMVLAAGVGERMQPLTDYLPKPLLPIANRPVMGHILAHLGRHGFTDVVANVYYRAEQIIDHFGDGSAYGVRLSYSREDQLWGSAGSVKRCEAFFGGETFLVTGADDLTDMDLTRFLQRHRGAGAVASIGLVEVEETAQFGIVVTDPGGRIARFVEKPQGPAPSHTANTQIYLFEADVHALIPPGEKYDFGFNVFPDLIARGLPFCGFALPGYWRDIGSLEGYLAAQWEVLEGKVQTQLPVPGTQVTPGVWVGEGCEIHLTATLEAPVVVGDRCRIGAGARLAGATAVASGVAVPAGTSLYNCVLWEEAAAPAGGEVRGAVICRDGILEKPAA